MTAYIYTTGKQVSIHSLSVGVGGVGVELAVVCTGEREMGREERSLRVLHARRLTCRIGCRKSCNREHSTDNGIHTTPDKH